MVIWLFGISGAGKTTLGLRLQEYFKDKDIKTFLLDGDIVRSFFDNDLGYGVDDRRANIKRIILATHILNENGVIPIVCNISPFDDLRCFMKKKIKDLNLIYLKRDLDECEKNDVKCVYQKSRKMQTTIGRDIVFDKPTCVDLIIETGKASIDESVAKILKFLNDKYTELRI